MEKSDIETISHFIKRPGMYIRKLDEENYISFITGFEIGSMNRCKLTTLIRNLISSKYKILYLSTGWPGQVKKLSETKSITWIEAFNEIATEVLENEKKQ